MKTICVMGLGYIGLPTASVFASNGFQVLGVDVDGQVVDAVNAGQVHIEEPGLKTLVSAAVGSGNLRAATAPGTADVFIIAVPTPLNDSGKTADMRFVREATEAIVPYLVPGGLVILESTSPPGTCRNLVAPILETSGLELGRDLYLAHCPERVLPGRILSELIGNDRIVGGYDDASARLAKDLYAAFVEGEILVTEITTAEMVKIVENTFRDVNIAFANETALLCEDLGIDFWQVAELASRHPRVNVHRAGPGVGGHCISVDPWFLVGQFPEDTALIHAARLRNDAMPAHVVRRTLDLLCGVDRPKVAALGLAFKGNVDDLRGSPALAVVEGLRAEGVDVAVHDYFVRHAPFELLGLDACFENADCVLLLTDHADYKYVNPRQVAELMRTRALFDTRHLLDHDDWRAAGFSVSVLGSGRN